ncbi:MAG: ABC transporter ATP-binding protein, partial [Bifidobacteriaceae bacterium]|nr:ABC transporter ATP-binding protein [Bifidobacteriaceae bacterium]
MPASTAARPQPAVPPTAGAPGWARVALRAAGLAKTYGSGGAAVPALRGVDLEIRRGELTAIMGPSGSGKSTLLHLLAALDRPSAGEVMFEGTGLAKASARQLTALRRDRLGFVFQQFNLVPTLTAWENITLPLDIGRKAYDMGWLNQLVDALDLRDRLGHRPAQLSGGQCQRVACARALAARPAVVFADEPTGNLDSAAAREVLAFLRQAVDQMGQTVVMVTHDPGAAAWADRLLFLADGRIVADQTAPSAEDALA